MFDCFSKSFSRLLSDVSIIFTTPLYLILLLCFTALIFIISYYIFTSLHEHFHYSAIKHYYNKNKKSNKDTNFSEELHCEIILSINGLLFNGFTQSNYLEYLKDNKTTHTDEIIKIARAGFRYSFWLSILLNIIGILLFCICYYFAILEYIFFISFLSVLLPYLAILWEDSNTSDPYIVKNPSEFKYEPRLVLDEDHYKKKKLRVIVIK